MLLFLSWRKVNNIIKNYFLPMDFFYDRSEFSEVLTGCANYRKDSYLWLITVSSTFQDADFDDPLLPLFIT